MSVWAIGSGTICLSFAPWHHLSKGSYLPGSPTDTPKWISLYKWRKQKDKTCSARPFRDMCCPGTAALTHRRCIYFTSFPMSLHKGQKQTQWMEGCTPKCKHRASALLSVGLTWAKPLSVASGLPSRIITLNSRPYRVYWVVIITPSKCITVFLPLSSVICHQVINLPRFARASHSPLQTWFHWTIL